MSKTTFKANPRSLEELLRLCGNGKIQLPDFQRSWVWAEDRILSLIASISRAFPVGALMSLEAKKGDAGLFARRRIQGSPPEADKESPDELLLDGQQRMTSLYQSCFRREVVQTITPKNKMVKRWFYINIRESLRPQADREEAIFTVPEDRRIKTNFDKDILLDLSSLEKEYEQMMFPLNQVFESDAWLQGLWSYWGSKDRKDMIDLFFAFKNEILDNFKSYQIPVITLADDTSHEAVCLVFEKVNTGGKPLDAFELLTAMYAAGGHKLREDWLGADAKPGEDRKVGIHERLSSYGAVPGQSSGVLSKVASTDFLQAIALLHTKQVRLQKAAEGGKEGELPAVRATRQSLLDLPLTAYQSLYRKVEEGFKQAAKFLREQNVYRVFDLPYQSQLVPMAAIFAELGEACEHTTNRSNLARWYWCGVFGELYGSAAESRFAKDILEVPDWLHGGPEPTTVRDGVLRADRLLTMRTRLSAAYKGIHALLMREGARDFRSGQSFDATVFFDEAVDIHHIFPEAWCKKQGIEAKVYDTVINKTPLGYRTNRIIGGVAPSEYLSRLEAGRKNDKGQIETPPIASAVLDEHLVSHCIDPRLLRADNFDAFMAARKQALLRLVEDATGHKVVQAAEPPDEEEPTDDIARDAEVSEEVA
ncbi:MAG: DUF262 domain-containing protein [Verrucomicrobiales bacterium]